MTAGVVDTVFQGFPSVEKAQEFVEQALRPAPAKRYIVLVKRDHPKDTGIYKSWDQMEPHIQLCPNPIYQSFPSRDLARAYLHKYQGSAPSNTRPQTGAYAQSPSSLAQRYLGKNTTTTNPPGQSGNNHGSSPAGLQGNSWARGSHNLMQAPFQLKP